MRTNLRINDGWLFAPEKRPADTPDSQFEPVTLPHPNITLPHHNLRDTEFQFASTYRRRFTFPSLPSGHRVFLDFDGAMMATTVSVNGHTFPEYRGGYTPFSYDITDHLLQGAENWLTVYVDSTERPDIPPFGGRVDYLGFGGIYRDVYLRTISACHIQNVFIKPQGLLTDEPRIEMQVTICNQTDETQQLVIVGALEYWRDEMEVIQIPPQTSITTSIWSDLRAYPNKDSYLWSPDNPKLHNFNFRLFQMKGFNSMDEKQLDALQIRTGLREAMFADDGFYLNGQKLKLIGLNRHQTYPYIGGAAPARLQYYDAEILRYDLGCNIVRTSHYPQSPHFLDRCDEIGLMVLEEIPGWQHIGDDYWKQLSLRDLGTMIERDRNHPSIILWGVRINESADDHDFYTATNKLAHQLDPTRQTTGTRYFQHSEFLEDVFGFNDFSNGIEQPLHLPFLITEFGGNMFPTKTWDNEERQVEHAIRHARVQNMQLGHPMITGALGWCAFDYNTHKDFGSGDHVCYTGMMDIFRLPKFAAYFYASQVPHQRKITLQAATFWTIGDRSGGGNNPVVVFSNVDEVEMFVGQDLIGRYEPAFNQFPNLPHPPFIIPVHMQWGEVYGNLLLVGYVNGKPVCEQQIALDGTPEHLRLETAHPELLADGSDMTWVWLHVVDLYGNRLPYSNAIANLSLSGPGQLIGDNPIALVGGQGGLLVRAGHEPGTITIRAVTPRLKPAEVKISVR